MLQSPSHGKVRSSNPFSYAASIGSYEDAVGDLNASSKCDVENSTEGARIFSPGHRGSSFVSNPSTSPELRTSAEDECRRRSGGTGVLETDVESVSPLVSPGACSFVSLLPTSCDLYQTYRNRIQPVRVGKGAGFCINVAHGSARGSWCFIFMSRRASNMRAGDTRSFGRCAVGIGPTTVTTTFPKVG